MSVHSEYHRALRALLGRLTESEFLVGEGWVEQLEFVQAEADRDLSTAAKTTLDLIARFEADLGNARPATSNLRAARGPLPSLELLRDACHHLRDHCRAILGVSPDDR